MPDGLTRAKVALFLAASSLGAGIVVAGRWQTLAGSLLILGGGFLLLGARWGVVAEYNGHGGQQPLPPRPLQLVNVAVQGLGVFFAAFGVLLLAGV